MRKVEKRLEEIEERVGYSTEARLRGDVNELCASLRDALVVIESQQETISLAMWFFKLRSKYPKWVEAYRRLFGEE